MITSSEIDKLLHNHWLAIEIVTFKDLIDRNGLQCIGTLMKSIIRENMHN